VGCDIILKVNCAEITADRLSSLCENFLALTV